MQKNPQAPNRKSWASRWITAGVFLTLIFSGYSLYKVLTLQPGEKTIVAPGLTIQKEIYRVDNVSIDENGELIVKYTDGSIRNVGQVRGEKGDTISPTNEQIALAVSNYCTNTAKCDGKNPTQIQVLQAVAQFCDGGICKGTDGRDAVVTADQILAAVTTYCSNERCRGATGATGAAGINGRTQQLACVLVTENNTPVRYYSAKYTDEPNSAYLTWQYRSRLPVWFQPNDCIDMRA